MGGLRRSGRSTAPGAGDRREPDAARGRGELPPGPRRACASRARSSSPAWESNAGGARARAASSRGGGTGQRVHGSGGRRPGKPICGAASGAASRRANAGAQASGGRSRERATVAAGGARTELPAAARRRRQSSAAPGHGRRVPALARSLPRTVTPPASPRAATSCRPRRSCIDARASLIDIAYTRAQFEHAIAALVGKPPAELSIAARCHVRGGVPAEHPAGVPSELLERRPDIAAAERRVGGGQRADRRRAGGVLSVALAVGGRRLQARCIGSLLSLPNRYWSLGAVARADDLRRRPAHGAAGRRRSRATTQRSRPTARPCSTGVPGSRGQPRRAALLAQEAAVQQEAVEAARQSASDRAQPVPGRHEQLHRRRRAAGRRAQQRAHLARHHGAPPHRERQSRARDGRRMGRDANRGEASSRFNCSTSPASFSRAHARNQVVARTDAMTARDVARLRRVAAPIARSSARCSATTASTRPSP